MRFIVLIDMKFTDYYNRKFEIEHLQKFGDVSVWDLGEFLQPQFSRSIAATRCEGSHVRRIGSWADLFRAFRDPQFRKVKGDQLAVLQFNENRNLRALICNILMKFRADTIMDFFNPGVPFDDPSPPDARPGGFVSRTFAKVIRLTRFIRDRQFSRSFRMVQALSMHSISILLRVRVTHRLIAGRAQEARYKDRSQSRGIQVVAGSSWDLSNSMAYQEGKYEPLVRGRYAVLLDGAGPAFASDEVLTGTRNAFTSDLWYPALTVWFEQLEQETGVKIVIAGHPKSAFTQYPKEFGFRQVFYGCTERLVKHAEFTITRASTAVNYAVIYRKPVICVYSNQTQPDSVTFKEQSHEAKALGVSRINVDAPPASTDEYRKVPEEAFGQYSVNYMTSLENPKPNYRVIVEDILGMGGDDSV